MNNNAGRLYGRARRIELVEKIIYFVVGVLVIALIIFLVSKYLNKTDDNINFAYLKNYMETNGYNCEMLQNSGGHCTLKSSNSTSTFIRNFDGFEFIVRTNAYLLNIKHTKAAEDYITFKTTTGALAGYKSKNYTCKTKDNILGEFEKCVDEDGNELDVNSYKGVVQMAIKDLNNFIDSSGYDKNKLLNDYEWVKK